MKSPIESARRMRLLEFPFIPFFITFLNPKKSRIRQLSLPISPVLLGDQKARTLQANRTVSILTLAKLFGSTYWITSQTDLNQTKQDRRTGKRDWVERMNRVSRQDHNRSDQQRDKTYQWQVDRPGLLPKNHNSDSNQYFGNPRQHQR